MENKFESDFKCHPLTKEQQDEACRAFDRQQQKSLERLVQMIESDPDKFVAILSLKDSLISALNNA